MADRAIVFSGPMIRALFAGVKFQTRRILKAPKWSTGEMECQEDHVEAIAKISDCFGNVPHPYEKGDRLWVKENCQAVVSTDETSCIRYLADDSVVNIENTAAAADNWLGLYDSGKGRRSMIRSSRFMPMFASRATLIVESVKYEELKDITNEDAIREGIRQGDDGWWGFGDTPEECNLCPTPAEAFHELWIDIHGKESWDENPIVVVPTFTFHPVNILKL